MQRSATHHKEQERSCRKQTKNTTDKLYIVKLVLKRYRKLLIQFLYELRNKIHTYTSPRQVQQIIVTFGIKLLKSRRDMGR